MKKQQATQIAAYCRSGEDAIKQYAEVKPDLVTMDIIMAYDDTFERAKAIGAKGFVDKPFHKDQLLRVFEQALL